MLESINWLNHGFIYRYFNKRNNRKQAAAIDKAMQSLGFKNPVLFIDNDFLTAFISRIF